MTDVRARRSGRAGRITLTRPQALNALTHAMVLDIHRALVGWRHDPGVDLVLIDSDGGRAFCAGGDIAAVYHAAIVGDHAAGRRFFADEYRMNAAVAGYPKPVVAFMNGYCMGGGVGLGGHASHRIVGATTRVAMPEAGIGLVPDVGGSWRLARAPGRIGEYLALTAAQMGPGDAIHAGFADTFLPEDRWPDLAARLEETGDAGLVKGDPPPPPSLAHRDLSAFAEPDLPAVMAALTKARDTVTKDALAANSPLSMQAGLRLVRAARGDSDIRQSLSREYRFTSRASQDSDFLEGVRARIIDKDRRPRWTADAGAAHVAAMLAPLGPDDIDWTADPCTDPVPGS